MIKRCIVFDNENQSEEIEKLTRDAKRKGITIECHQFNVGSTQLSEVLTEGAIDITKVVNVYRERFRGITFHLAAFDWDLEDSKIDGIELIRQLKINKILHQTPKIVYSGLIDEILKGFIRDNTADKAVTKIKSLIKADIRGYHGRDSRDIEIISFFLSNIESLDLIIEEELRKFPTLIYDNPHMNPKFDKIIFSELADYLDNNSVTKNEFKKELITQIIAYITKSI